MSWREIIIINFSMSSVINFSWPFFPITPPPPPPSSLLEQKMLEMEVRHRDELETLKQEKGSLQTLVGRQSGVIRELEAQLSRATGNSTALQRQQQEMMDTVHNLLNLCSKDGGKWTGIQILHIVGFGAFSNIRVQPRPCWSYWIAMLAAVWWKRMEMKKVITY